METHAKWRIKRALLWGWIVQEWDGIKWEDISIRFESLNAAQFYLHCNALVECALDNEDWKLLE